MYSATDSWESLYKKSELAYPTEGVIRIFKGKFPNLKLDNDFAGKSICDLGYGDGRHFPLFDRLNLKCHGVEISEQILQQTRDEQALSGLNLDLRVGNAANIPFEDESFDYLMSWNSCYYMTHGGANFDRHVEEMSRVVKKGGYFIVSVPTSKCFIFKDSTESRPGYRTIQDDYFQVRNGEEMRCFTSSEELEKTFSGDFENFSHAEIDMDWFGLSYNWFVMVARKK